jgi:hypothetical protein
MQRRTRQERKSPRWNEAYSSSFLHCGIRQGGHCGNSRWKRAAQLFDVDDSAFGWIALVKSKVMGGYHGGQPHGPPDAFEHGDNPSDIYDIISGGQLIDEDEASLSRASA